MPQKCYKKGHIISFALLHCRTKPDQNKTTEEIPLKENIVKPKPKPLQNRAQIIHGSSDNLLDQNNSYSSSSPHQNSKYVSEPHQNKLKRGVSGMTNMSSQYDVGTTDRMKLYINDQHKRTYTHENLSRFQMDANKFGPGTATKERMINPEDAMDNASVHMSTVRDFHSLSRMNRTAENKLKRRDSYRSKKSYPPGTIVGKNISENSDKRRRPVYSGNNDNMKLQTNTTERGRKFAITKNTDL